MQEYLEIFDEYNHPLHLTKLRRLVHEEGNWHRTSQIYVLSNGNELLCNLRSPLKDVFPLLWDVSIGGHLAPGETYQDCALRELAEELGIPVEQDDIRFITTVKIDGKDEKARLIDREHAGIFVFRTSLQAHEFNYQQDEIVELHFFPLSYIKENLRLLEPQLPIIPLQKQFLQIISEIERCLGME